MKMRAWRRGVKEMDIVLGPFADAHLDTMSDADLDLYDTLLNEYDQDLMVWFTSQKPAPEEYTTLLKTISDFSENRDL
ncbi:MAG: succinate dehydrogenase assembly factor 2 [Halocynthiibacter sp.]